MAGGAALAGMAQGHRARRRRRPRRRSLALVLALASWPQPRPAVRRLAPAGHTTALVMLSEVVFASLSSVALGAADSRRARWAGRRADPRGRGLVGLACALAGGRRPRTIGRMSTVYDFEAPPASTADRAAGAVPRQGAADRQHRQRLRLHAAVRRAGGTAQAAYGGKGWRCWAFPATSSARRTPAATTRSRVLPAELRRELPDDVQDRRQRRRRPPAVPVAHGRSARACWAARRSSGTSPSSWSARTA
jgi:hypothetical protein